MSAGHSVRIPLGLVIALLVAFGLLWTSREPAETTSALSPTSEQPAPGEPPATGAIEALTPDARQATDQTREVVVESVPPETARGDADTCVVLGRIVDEHDRPIVEARVRLAAYQLWAKGLDVPRLDGSYDYRGFEVATDGAGEFRIAAPVPTAERTWLKIEPDPYHDSVRVTFGGQRGDDQPALVAGERDLGVLRLATTGAIRGRVSDSSGRPLADAKLSIGPDPYHTYGRDTTTAADGSYIIAHAPVGSYGVSARAEGSLAQFRKPVLVEGARDTIGVDFALELAPTIEGIVLDELGRPIEGARLYGWPITSGRGAGAISGVDGRFSISLPQDEPYTLGAKLDGYRSWGDEQDRSVIFQPGMREIEVRLQSMPLVRFSVVDAASGEPVERFGLRILEGDRSRSSRYLITESRRPPPQGTHPGGVIEVGARAGIDRFLVAADGYALAQGDVEYDSPDSPCQLVRLRRGASASGRMWREGERSVSRDAAIDGLVLVPAGVSPGGLAVRLGDRHDGRSAVTDSAGNFRFEELAPGRRKLALGGRPGELTDSEAVDVELVSGERLSVTLDARDRGTCQVTLVIELGGLSAKGAQVELVSVADSREHETLGRCDEAGRVTGHPRAWGEARVVVRVSGRRMEHPAARLRLDRGAELEELVRFELSSVTLVLPAGVEPPSSGDALLRLRAPDVEEPAQTARLSFREGRPDASIAEVARAGAGSLWFGYLPPGAYELSLELIEDDAETQLVPLGDGSYSFEDPAFWQATRSVVLRAGEELRVVFE